MILSILNPSEYTIAHFEYRPEYSNRVYSSKQSMCFNSVADFLFLAQTLNEMHCQLELFHSKVPYFGDVVENMNDFIILGEGELFEPLPVLFTFKSELDKEVFDAYIKAAEEADRSPSNIALQKKLDKAQNSLLRIKSIRIHSDKDFLAKHLGEELWDAPVASKPVDTLKPNRKLVP